VSPNAAMPSSKGRHRSAAAAAVDTLPAVAVAPGVAAAVARGAAVAEDGDEQADP
jgi:hypothetical protein